MGSNLLLKATITEANNIAKRYSPDDPSLLDRATWFIGRQWCEPKTPKCKGCEIKTVCLKRIHLGKELYD